MQEFTENTLSYRHELQEFITLRRSYLARELGATAVQAAEESDQLITEVISALTGIDGLYDVNAVNRGVETTKYDQVADDFMFAYQELYGTLGPYTLQNISEHLVSLIKYSNTEPYRSTTLSIIVDQFGELHPTKEVSSLDERTRPNRHSSDTIRDTDLAIAAFERLRETTAAFGRAHGLR